MKKLLAIIGAFFFVGSINATPIDITVPDGYTAVENGNVNFGSLNTQEWDLEKFVFDNTTNRLSMVSGFNAFGGHQESVKLGDIFIDVNSNNTWDYVINFNQGTNVLSNQSYTVMDIRTGTPTFVDLQSPYNSSSLDPNDPSNSVDHSGALPYALQSGGTQVGVVNSFTYSNSSYGEGTHYTLGDINLAFIAGNSFSVHQTFSCGNDLLVGKYVAANVPEPSLITLLGCGLLGLVFVRRRK